MLKVFWKEIKKMKEILIMQVNINVFAFKKI